MSRRRPRGSPEALPLAAWLDDGEGVPSPPSASEPIAEYLDNYPAVFSAFLDSEAKEQRDETIPLLVDYLRERGRKEASVMLLLLAALLDPKEQDIGWRLRLERRGRGRRRTVEQWERDQKLKREVDRVEAQLRAAGKKSPRKAAVGAVAHRHRMTDGMIEDAIARTKKAPSK